MSSLRTGIVGAGFGAIAHLPALRNHPRFEVVAIASPHKAAGIAADAGVPYAFPSCEEMLKGCDADAVVVASPPFAHRDDVLAALSAGKHVLCEKPFALNVAQAREMRDAAAAAGTACGLSHEFRFVPEVQAIRELIRNGHLGALRNIEITMLRPTLRESERRARSWWFERERGGGLTGAILSHMVDQACWLAGRSVVRSMGMERTANPERHDESGSFISNVADGAAAIVDYGDGLIARICADGTAAVESYTLAAAGERRTAVASGHVLDDLTLYAVDSDVTDELTCKVSPYSSHEEINGNVPLLMELYDEWVKTIEGQPSELPTFEEALVTQEILAAAGYGA